jgi:hypothetical protein
MMVRRGRGKYAVPEDHGSKFKAGVGDISSGRTLQSCVRQYTTTYWKEGYWPTA